MQTVLIQAKIFFNFSVWEKEMGRGWIYRIPVKLRWFLYLVENGQVLLIFQLLSVGI